MDVFILNSDLMVSRPQVNLGENCSTSYLVKQIIDPWKGILIINGHLIELSILYAKT
jgi:hypothetical protein